LSAEIGRTPERCRADRDRCGPEAAPRPARISLSRATLLEEAGYTALTPGWPDDPETLEEANAHPGVFAGKSVGDIADHMEAFIRRLDRRHEWPTAAPAR
jgi:hypothetical protein